MGGFIRVIAIAFLIWYGIKFIIKFLFPSLSNSDKSSNQQTMKKEGEVTVHLDKQRQKEFRQKEKKGDYVDYEEVE